MDNTAILHFLKVNILFTIQDSITMEDKYRGTYQSYIVPRIGEYLEMNLEDENGEDRRVSAKVTSVFHTIDEIDTDVHIFLDM